MVSLHLQSKLDFKSSKIHISKFTFHHYYLFKFQSHYEYLGKLYTSHMIWDLLLQAQLYPLKLKIQFWKHSCLFLICIIWPVLSYIMLFASWKHFWFILIVRRLHFLRDLALHQDCLSQSLHMICFLYHINLSQDHCHYFLPLFFHLFFPNFFQ